MSKVQTQTTMKPTIANYTPLALARFYIIMLGGGNYEQLNVTNLVVSAPPQSLYILQGDYGFKPFAFWLLFRPLTILLFIAAIALNWKFTGRRKLLLIAFGVDIATTLATFLYFAPETEVIINIPFASTPVDPALIDRAILWKNLNWVRLAGFYLGGILLLVSLMKTPDTSRS